MTASLATVPALDVLVRLVAWIALAPLLPGVVNRVKAWVAGRRAPPVLQLYYDLARLWRKSLVLSTVASPGFLVGPVLAWSALLRAAMHLPVGPAGAELGFEGDAILLLYLLALARFATAWAAMEPGSSFGAMGAAREVSFAVLSEAALVAGLLSLCVATRSVSLATMLAPSAGQGVALMLAGLSPNRGLVTTLAAFALFRLFDIWKPGPVGRAERLPGGLGILADDLLAGAIAGVLTLGVGALLP